MYIWYMYISTYTSEMSDTTAPFPVKIPKVTAKAVIDINLEDLKDVSVLGTVQTAWCVL